jgi:hypothetical protein
MLGCNRIKPLLLQRYNLRNSPTLAVTHRLVPPVRQLLLTALQPAYCGQGTNVAGQLGRQTNRIKRFKPVSSAVELVGP